jgi:ATP-dependent DNA helicase RecG
MADIAQTDKLATPVQYVKGVGPKLAQKLAKLGIETVGDLLMTVPSRYVDRRRIDPISELSPGRDRTVVGTVARAGVTFLGRRRRRIFEVILKDESGVVSAKFFHFKQKFFQERFQVGRKVLFSGEVSFYGHKVQFIHPEVEIMDEDKDTSDVAGKIMPVYPLTEGLYQKTMRKIVRNAWDAYGQFVGNVFPENLINQFGLADPWESLQTLHFPAPDVDVDMLSAGATKAHRSLIFDEFFFLELGMALKRQRLTLEKGISFPRDDDYHRSFVESLPFELTGAQVRCIEEIRSDMAKPIPMNRLLQGDVGSGKTVVALAVALQAIRRGYQVAMMAPTEILAEQHFETITTNMSRLEIPHGLLTSTVKGSEREAIVKMLASGEMPLVVGTHALIQEGVEFNRLGFVVIDEQHRFGVMQRAALKKKGGRPDVLIMTATPIPRTLAMTLYGDLDVSVIDEMPKGRLPVVTKLYSENQRQKMYDGMLKELEKGRQCYVVYPLVEESEKIDLKNATDMSKELAGVFEPNFHVELLHGRMNGDQKESIMNRFKAGHSNVLVATSVVEVGVDVPNASVMVIEHAERFGLSQLHQLRGRVGRSTHQSWCILMADWKRSEDAKRRLEIMTQTNDGFRIAEEDLSIRGPGEFIGTRQSGIPEFRVANLVRDFKLLALARQAAFDIVAEDRGLCGEDNKLLRETLETRWRGKLELASIS